MDEESYMIWQDVFDCIAAGRPGEAACPSCGHRPLEITDTPQATKRVECSKCKTFIEARLA